MSTKKLLFQNVNLPLDSIDAIFRYGHHAFLIIAPKEEVIDYLRDYFLNDSKNNCPDFLIYEEGLLSVSDARKIVSFDSSSPLVLEQKIIVIATNRLTVEAQNALLKTFEEPSGNSKFFIIIQDVEHLLPTIKSRLFIIDLQKKLDVPIKKPSNDIKLSPDEFLRLGIKDRMNLVKKIQDAVKAEKLDRGNVLDFINGLEYQLSTFFVENCKDDKLAGALKKLEVLRGYILDKGSSVKQVLTVLAISLPIYK